MKLPPERGRRIGDRKVGARKRPVTRASAAMRKCTRYEVRDSEPIPTLGVRIAGLTFEKRGAENGGRVTLDPFVGAKRTRVARCSGQESSPSRQRWNPVDPVK